MKTKRSCPSSRHGACPTTENARGWASLTPSTLWERKPVCPKPSCRMPVACSSASWIPKRPAVSRVVPSWPLRCSPHAAIREPHGATKKSLGCFRCRYGPCAKRWVPSRRASRVFSRPSWVLQNACVPNWAHRMPSGISFSVAWPLWENSNIPPRPLWPVWPLAFWVGIARPSHGSARPVGCPRSVFARWSRRFNSWWKSPSSRE